MLDLNDELDHHGVKGMRWGRRKKRTSTSDTGTSKSKASKKKLTRAEVRAERNAFYMARSERAVDTALRKKGDTFIYTSSSPKVRGIVMTGSEFIEYISKGGAFDTRVTRVYATKDESGKFAVDDRLTERFVRSDKDRPSMWD